MFRLPPSAVVNIDETNIDFDMPATTTLERRGVRSVSVSGTGSSQRATLLLGVAMDGAKLPPFIVWKEKNLDGSFVRSHVMLLEMGFQQESLCRFRTTNG